MPRTFDMDEEEGYLTLTIKVKFQESLLTDSEPDVVARLIANDAADIARKFVKDYYEGKV